MLINVNMQKTVEVLLAADVAASGTITVNYPDNMLANAFSLGGHKISIVNGGTLKVFDDFTVAFNAANVVVTLNSTAATLPAGTKLFLELALKGRRDDVDVSGIALAGRLNRRQAVEINLGKPVAPSANSLIASQNLTAAGVASVNGSAKLAILASAIKGIFDVPRNVVAAWTTAAVLTVYGYDEYGKPMIEVSASGTSFTGAKAFKRVTNVTVSADVTGLTVGSGKALGLPVYLPATTDVISTLSGTLAAGITAKSTGTTGDVRGTYSPTTAPDGLTAISMLAMIESPDYMGPAQYNG